MKRNLLLFLSDILENIKDIEEFSKNMSKEDLSTDKLKQKAIIRSIEIIGEAIKNFPESFREKYPDIPWKDLSGFRDVMIHGYFKVDLNIVWKAVKMNYLF